MLRGEAVPRWKWIKLECVVRYLADIAVRQLDVDATVRTFHELWLAVVAADQASGTATDPHVATAGPLTAIVASVLPAPLLKNISGAPAPDLVGDLPPRNTGFVGREHQIGTIDKVLRAGPGLLTLNGIGGVGKTQLAVEYVYRFRDHYELIWWVPAEHPSRLRASLAALGARLGLPGSEAMQHPPAQVLEALGRSPLRWILVFDNVGPPDSLPSLAELGSGRVLLTSRDPDWAGYGPTFEVDVFERTESVVLLRSRGIDITSEDADRLADRLGDLPLAVEQAAAWRVATGIAAADYIDRLDQQVQEILSHPKAKAANYPTTLAAFLNFAFDQLSTTSPVATQLFELFASLSAEPLSLTLLRSGRQGFVTSPLREALHQPPSLNLAVRELRRYGLLKVVGADPPRLQVHRLFQRALRDWLTAAQLQRGRANVRAILAAANPGEPDDSRFWEHYAEVGPHIGPAELATAPDFEVRRVALDQVRYLHQIGHYEQSMALGQRLVLAAEGQGNGFETDHDFIVLAKHHLANAMRILGDREGARRLTLDALDYMERNPVFGPDHEYFADLDKNRAVDLRISGEYARALVVDKGNLDRHLRSDTDDQDKIRLIRNNIAVSHRLLGRFREAHDLDLEIVHQLEVAHGEQDPRTLFTRANLARDLYGLGRYKEALETLRAILPTYRTTVGSHHHWVLLAVRTEVMALRKLGRYKDAVALAEQNSSDLTTWFGADHEYTLAAGISLVNNRLAAGDLRGATVKASQVLGGCERLFGSRHPMTLAMLVNSTAAMRALGDYRGARRRDEKAVTDLKQVLGDDHPYTVCAMHNLAIDLALLGHEDQALRETETVLRRSQAVRGTTHPDTVAAAINLSLIKADLGDRATGQANLASALTSLERLLGAGHPHLGAAKNGVLIECDIEPPPT
ncbi:MAG TPA: FxSxx-COOH system tetratricopeptide repeat protein [Pseudonocardiaceae bacterium]|nr:FxSxx-COOH system tetratricopeptide repeat protein [Pseudonocardiaceae bacterium]